MVDERIFPCLKFWCDRKVYWIMALYWFLCYRLTCLGCYYVRTVVAVRRAGFKTALKSVLRSLFAHPLHSEKKTISCAIVFFVTLWTKTISDQQRGNFFRYIRKEDNKRLPTRQLCREFILQSLYKYEQLEFISFNDGMLSFKNIMQSSPITDARPAFHLSNYLPFYTSICQSIAHLYIHLSLDLYNYLSIHRLSISTTGCRPSPPSSTRSEGM